MASNFQYIKLYFLLPKVECSSTRNIYNPKDHGNICRGTGHLYKISIFIVLLCFK